MVMNGTTDLFAETSETSESSETASLTLNVGARAQWFSLGDVHVDLSRRKPVARLLWALVVAAERDPNARAGLTTAELIAAGWPGERLVRNAGRIRLRVAVATLRTMGLVSRLVTTPSGYMIAGPLSITLAESDAPQSIGDLHDLDRAEAS